MLERLKSMFRKQSRSGAVVYHSQKQAKWMARRYKSFAEEGYTKNVIAYQAIKKISDTAASVPLMLKRRDQEITDSPVLRLLERPNPTQSGSDLMRAIVGFYFISGNGYIERTMVGNTPRELYTLRPDRVKINPGPMGWPRSYEFTTGSESIVWEVDQATGQADLLHLKTFNPLDDWYGLSPLEAGAYAVDQHNGAMSWMQALLQNGAAPSGAMTSQEALSDEAFDRLKAQIDEQYAGASNAGRPMLLEGGMTWQSMGFSPDQMTAIETRHASARDVSLALGVPPLLLGIPGDSTYNNYREARLALYEETVIPLIENICDGLTNWLLPAFGDGLILVPDVDAIAAIADKRREMWSMADASDDLTINERREIKGYSPITGGDTILVSATQVPLSLAIGPDDDFQALAAMPVEELKALAYGETKAAPDELDVGDFVRWRSSGGPARGRVTRIVRSGSVDVPDTDFTINADEDDPAALIRVYRPVDDGWEPIGPIVGHRFSALTKIQPLPEPSEQDQAFRPTEAMANEAKRGLEWRREFGRGGTEVGVARARDISNRANLSLETVRRMHSFFSRHEESSKGAEGFRPGEDGYPSAGRIAWALWGGDAGQSWARNISNRED